MVIPNRYALGDTVTFAANFQVADADHDPTTVKFTIRNPTGIETTYVYGTDPELTKISVGDYEIELTLNISRSWHYEWEAEGVNKGLIEQRVIVRRSKVTGS